TAEVRWFGGPRTLDIDILLYGDKVVKTPSLTIPHPRMHERAFVLVPLAEIAPEARHPVLGMTVRELLQRVDAKGVWRFDPEAAYWKGLKRGKLPVPPRST
ncbi:MAG: 2-amino-4-hydroxy-6-hydroxymethyldihydropteridine diphosphokinase, partial [Chloroflexi bacterium]|nr:2-amino-4-hydroxy-6-hydroxymethyldihydropteridine diphosphokinase [Chloroflexota bacterium]